MIAQIYDCNLFELNFRSLLIIDDRKAIFGSRKRVIRLLYKDQLFFDVIKIDLIIFMNAHFCLHTECCLDFCVVVIQKKHETRKIESDACCANIIFKLRKN